MKYAVQFVSSLEKPVVFWKRAGVDSLLALGGIALATALISLTHLYPRIPTIPLAFLLIVLALAGSRGLYAAILASFLAVSSYLYFLVQPLYTFIIPRVEDLFTLVIFLITAIITSQLASSLRLRAAQARSRAQELSILYEQAQELAALQERQRLARELHDSVSQVLYSIGLGTHAAREALANGEITETASSLDYVINLTEAGMVEMRALIFELRPESLEKEGLVAALNKQIAVLRTRHKLTVEAHLDNEPHLTYEQKHALYRITQEALHNIVKHARASLVTLKLTSQEQQVTLEICDNGRGFDPTGSFPGHLGIRSMHERAEKIGAALTIESNASKGTHVHVLIPQHSVEAPNSSLPRS